MTVSHSTDALREVRTHPAIRIMERQTQPLKFGREPYWRAPIVPASAEVHIPTWSWTTPHDLPEGEPVAVFGINGGYLAAMGDVAIAHSHLRHTGPLSALPPVNEIAPGYYQISVPHWAFSGTIVHPLGRSPRLEGESLWITAPTLILLLELEDEGHLGLFRILDSWTADTVTDLTSWAVRLRSLRTELLDLRDIAQTDAARAHASKRLAAFEESYTDALDMMLTGQECHTRRPDWAHTVYAHHAASIWRAAWRWTDSGRPLAAMPAVGEIAVLSTDVGTVLSRPTPPFKIDPSGREVGFLNPTRVTFVGCEPQRLADMVTISEDDDQ